MTIQDPALHLAREYAGMKPLARSKLAKNDPSRFTRIRLAYEQHVATLTDAIRNAPNLAHRLEARRSLDALTNMNQPGDDPPSAA